MVVEFLDNFDEIKQKILEHTGWSEEELNEKLSKKQEEYGGLLTVSGAAYSIAKDLGVDLNEGNETKIKDLADGMTFITIIGRIKAVGPTRSFFTKTRKGKVTNLEISDETGETRLVVWGKEEQIKKLSKNDLIKVTNAYTKNNNGRIEIHAGTRAEIKVINDDNSSIKKHEEKILKLSEVNDEITDFDFYARVERINPCYEFNKNGKISKVSSIVVNDGTAAKRLVLWEPHAELVNELAINDLIKVENAYSRKNQELEIHLGWKGRIIKNPEGIEIPEVKINRKKISKLDGTEEYVQVKADVVEVFQPTIIKICLKCGATVLNQSCTCGSNEFMKTLIINAIIDDGTGNLRTTFYRRLAERFIGMNAGEYEANQEIFNKKRKELLGQELIFSGTMKKVPEFDRIELIVKNFSKPNYANELKMLEGMI